MEERQQLSAQTPTPSVRCFPLQLMFSGASQEVRDPQLDKMEKFRKYNLEGWVEEKRRKEGGRAKRKLVVWSRAEIPSLSPLLATSNPGRMIPNQPHHQLRLTPFHTSVAQKFRSKIIFPSNVQPQCAEDPDSNPVPTSFSPSLRDG